MDRSELRELTIDMHGLRNMDDEYTFYYDETNNIRKFHIVEDGFNVVDPGNFVLAGVVCRGLSEKTDFESLFLGLQLPKNVGELKLKTIAKGDFLSVLKSDKVGKIFRWLLENNIYIHYFNLNVVYWSLADIVDSVLSATKDPFFMAGHMSVKSDIYKVVVSDREEFVSGARKFGFPNIETHLAAEFAGWFCSFVRSNAKVLNEDRAYLLNVFIESMENLNGFPFLEGERSHILIESFSAFYSRNLYMYPTSQHVFDSEKNIEGELESFLGVGDGGSAYSYTFVDSKSSRAVQVSDVIAGVLGKLFTFLREAGIDQLAEVKSNLHGIQADNLQLLVELIDRSDAVSNGFFNMVASEDEYLKRNYFLYGADGT